MPNGTQRIKPQNATSFIERIGNKIPDPIVIFLGLYVIILTLTGLLGGFSFETIGQNGTNLTYEIKNMFATENIRWIFSNALVDNWLGYAGGILGTILIVMLGVGIAEESGMLSALIRKLGGNISDRYLPYLLVFLGILSNIATDAGYIILIPLAGLLYAGIGKNPLIGMAAAFAGVSAGFSANIMPATVIDIIIGTNAQAFATNQGVPFVSSSGVSLNPMTMHYYFMLISTVLLVVLGGFVTQKWVKPKLEKQYYQVPADINIHQFQLTKQENKALRWSGLGFCIAVVMVLALAIGPLSPYIDPITGEQIIPYLDSIILLITFIFFVAGLFYGCAIGRFKNISDVVQAMAKQMGSMGYVLVLTFFCYNFLALLSYSNLGTFITFIGAQLLKTIGLANSPILLIIGFIIITAVINLFVGGLTAKWMLLGPIFIPMLYHVNGAMTPDIVAAAYRVADSSTNIITPLMTYAGVILMYMRKYHPKLSIGDMIGIMVPYSVTFLISWTILLIIFIVFKLPLGF